MKKPGVYLKINPLFLLVLVLFACVGKLPEVIIAFLLVFLHELAHVWVACRLGYSIFKIELFPFGGMAEYCGLLETSPGQELKVALAGPVLNFVLAGFFYIVGSSFTRLPPFYLGLLLRYNLLLGFFNLLPALPLDGGRVLRALLVLRTDLCRGSEAAIRVSRYLAVGGMIVGVIAFYYNVTNIWVLFVAFFVYGAALREKQALVYNIIQYLTQRQKYLEQINLKPVYIQLVRGDLPLDRVIKHMNPERYNLFYVFDNNLELAGIVPETRMIDRYFSQTEIEQRVIDIL